VWVPDVQGVRDHLVAPREGKKRVRVEFGAVSGDRSQPDPESGPRDPISIDVHITEKMNLSKYSVVVFAGRNVDEYTSDSGGGRRAVGYIIKTMQDSGKPVAAISSGQAVLAAHGALNDRRAALPPAIAGDAKFQWMFNKDMPVTWQKVPVVTDATGAKGKVITAAGPAQSKPFAEAIFKAIDK
jgi:putative intracellular protease/amidase